MPAEEREETVTVWRAEGIMNPDESLSGSGAGTNPPAPLAVEEAVVKGGGGGGRGLGLGGRQQEEGGGDDAASQSSSSEGSIPELRQASSTRLPVPRFQLRRQPSGACGGVCVWIRVAQASGV